MKCLTERLSIDMRMKFINGYDGKYSISNDGRIRSHFPRTIEGKFGGWIKPFVSNWGYKIVILSNNKTRKHHLVHRLVADAFVCNQYNKLQVNHLDGNKLNNCVKNLEWATSSEDLKHSYKKGLRSGKGEKNSQAKLTLYQVEEIRNLLALNEISQQKIADKFGVSQKTISLIKRKERWNEI